jgi:hypothetical protein
MRTKNNVPLVSLRLLLELKEVVWYSLVLSLQHLALKVETTVLLLLCFFSQHQHKLKGLAAGEKYHSLKATEEEVKRQEGAQLVVYVCCFMKVVNTSIF